MADYGLKIWNADGDLTLDLTDTVTRLRYTVDVSMSTTGNVTLSDISGKTTIQFCLPGTSRWPHVVTRSGTTITWTRTITSGSTENTILVFIQD